MANYTKGEWVKQGSFIFSSEIPPRLIAEAMRSNMAFSEQQANAHLIASAPAMYEVLQWVSKIASHSPSDSQVITMAIKALSKTEGRNV